MALARSTSFFLMVARTMVAQNHFTVLRRGLCLEVAMGQPLSLLSHLAALIARFNASQRSVPRFSA